MDQDSKEQVSEKRRQLRDLATTCKNFKDPAVEILWTKLDSLVPLIKLLPGLTVIDNTYVSFLFPDPQCFRAD